MERAKKRARWDSFLTARGSEPAMSAPKRGRPCLYVSSEGPFFCAGEACHYHSTPFERRVLEDWKHYATHRKRYRPDVLDAANMALPRPSSPSSHQLARANVNVSA